MPLFNTKEMLKKACSQNYAVGAFNINNMEILQGIMSACNRLNSPVILQVSEGARLYAGSLYLVSLIKSAVKIFKDIPLALHLDHGRSFEMCKTCIEEGFTSVMIDGSHLPYERNVALTKAVADYAHKKDVTVEGELGRLAGTEENIDVENMETFYTNPKQVKDFIYKTNIDSVAVSVGASHGVCKFFKDQEPGLRFDILEKIHKSLENFPIVLHGSSSVDEEIIKKINLFGGKIKNTSGLTEKILKKAIAMGVCKINIDSDIRLVATASIREYMNDISPSSFDPRGYLGYARDKIEDIVAHKIEHVLGSKNKI
ncbi:MAG: ketose-bisphosphate aldolase [Oscillospiraceae bacterium]|jgi:fructose-bisphosphate aldolase class II|nr:ketose-bisphosphate aldolase [Oscillospiraceae bacterium]